MDVGETIAAAERVLPGHPAGPGETDARWQAIIALEKFIPEEADAVWMFIERWGKSRDDDLRTCIATCLLEHLLEHHFERFFERVERSVQASPYFADTYAKCWRFGRSEQGAHSSRFEKLRHEAIRLSAKIRESG